jgi:hypothetical protein
MRSSVRSRLAPPSFPCKVLRCAQDFGCQLPPGAARLAHAAKAPQVRSRLAPRSLCRRSTHPSPKEGVRWGNRFPGRFSASEVVFCNATPCPDPPPPGIDFAQNLENRRAGVGILRKIPRTQDLGLKICSMDSRVRSFQLSLRQLLDEMIT